MSHAPVGRATPSLRHVCGYVLALLVVTPAGAPLGLAGQQAPPIRARDLGIPFSGVPGEWNAITDVAGVEVGHTTLISGDGTLVVGQGPVRTGVTAVLPRGRSFGPVFAGWYSLNGNGEMTGTTWIEESGFLEGPVMITNTHSVGVVRDAVIQWMRDDGIFDPLGGGAWWALPVVAETYDGGLNDINGFHVKPEHALEALRASAGGAVAEGGVGGGTGMVCHQFKGGIGTSSRRVGEHTVGVLVQCNYGGRRALRIAGVPVGEELTDRMPEFNRQDDADPDAARSMGVQQGAFDTAEFGSIIVVVATDAPLLPHQLKRLARRVPMGIGRMGGIASNGSGDIFVAFSTANADAWSRQNAVEVDMLPNDALSPIFEATVEATEEAIVNALVAGQTMTGINGNRVYGIPQDELRAILGRFGRLESR